MNLSRYVRAERDAAALARLQAIQPPVDAEDAYQGWLNRYEDVLWGDQRTHGAVCLCHEGCAYRDWFVVTGPLRGQMWDDERWRRRSRAQQANDGSTLTFGHWYRITIDRGRAYSRGPAYPF